MKRRRRSNAVVIALYANAALLCAILALLIGRNSSSGLTSSAFGQQAPIAGGAGVFVMPAQFSTSRWGCYLMDIDAQTLCAYEYTPGDHQLRLVSARWYRYDRQLKRYNTSPDPNEIKKLTEDEQNAGRVIDSTPGTQSPEEPKGE